MVQTGPVQQIGKEGGTSLLSCWYLLFEQSNFGLLTSSMFHVKVKIFWPYVWGKCLSRFKLKGKGWNEEEKKTVTKVATLKSESLRVNIINVSSNFSNFFYQRLPHYLVTQDRTKVNIEKMPCGHLVNIACSAEILWIYIFSQMMWIIQMKVPIAKRTDENDNFSVVNDPDHPNELVCCKKDGPE